MKSCGVLISGEIPAVLPADLARAILADLRKKDRPGVRVIAACME